MLEQFLDKKWIAAGLPKNFTYYSIGRRLPTETLQHLRDFG